jgi:hypothetical protein
MELLKGLTNLLIIKAQLGDKKALNQMLMSIEEPLFNYIKRILNHHLDHRIATRTIAMLSEFGK